MKRLAFLLAVAGATVSSPAGAQFCPSYTASSTNNDNGCAIEAAPGTDPTTEEWNDIFDLVSRGPAAWGDAGPTVADIGQGCGLPEAYQEVPALFPCELLKAIVRTESGWTQFCVPTTPSDQVGGASRTIISFDCGYGASQVTSGMRVGETPDFDRERVASDPTYNLATGTRILASKWRSTECVGDNQPVIIEHWYTATWAYNGLAYINNPNHPNYDPARGVYDPQVGGSAPYQEKVFGRIEHTGDLWEPTPLAYPNPGDVGADGSPPQLPEPSCASPTDCTATRPVHETACQDDPDGGGGGTPSSVASTGVGAGGATSATTGGGSTAGAGGSFNGPSLDDEESCGCRTVGLPRDPASPRWTFLALLVLVGLRRRRP